ncbi:hypothetical protein Hanom_Chr00s021258g01760691 [Helianthus anomalus]
MFTVATKLLAPSSRLFIPHKTFTLMAVATFSTSDAPLKIKEAFSNKDLHTQWKLSL